MAVVCVSVGAQTPNQLLEKLSQQKNAGVSMAELRLDLLEDFSIPWNELRQQGPPTLLATARRPEDGGQWKHSETQRRALLQEAIDSNIDYVDIESDVAGDFPRSGPSKRVISLHDMTGLAEPLEDLPGQLADLDADVIKIAVRSENPADVARLLKLYSTASKPAVIIGMGEILQPTRVLSARVGAPWMYAVPDDNAQLAPGMLTAEQMYKIYRYEKISSSTRVFGVVGDPIGHSLSPLLHNSALAHDDIDAVYLPFRVPTEYWNPWRETWAQLELAGLSVTIPHKPRVAQEAGTLDPLTEQCGAGNTLVWSVMGQDWWAMNTDGPAAVAAWNALADHDDLSDQTALILGAGGVGRTLAFAFQQAGAKVIVCNRSPDKAQALADELQVESIPWNDRGQVNCQLLVNATSVGMTPREEESPFPLESLRQGMTVFETIYTPQWTVLRQSAHDKGLATVSGREMFFRQADLQYQAFTGKKLPDAVRPLVFSP